MTKEKYRYKGIKFIEVGKFKTGIAYLHKSLRLGDKKAINDLGVAYEKLCNYKKAFEYYKKSTNINDGSGWNNLGWMYLTGDYVKQDIKHALKCFEKSAKSGSPYGYFSLYLVYTSNEHGVRPNYKKAMNYLEMGAEKEIENNENCDTCVIQLNYNLLKGKYTKRQVKKSFETLQRAEKLNTAQIKYNLGCHYAFGRGVKKDLQKAIELFKESYSLGNYDAYSMVAQIYLKLNDPVLAYFYFRRGMDHDSIECANAYLEACLSERYKNTDYNLDKAAEVSYLTMYFLEEADPNKYKEERNYFKELRQKYKEKCNFEKIELAVKKALNKRNNPHIVA